MTIGNVETEKNMEKLKTLLVQEQKQMRNINNEAEEDGIILLDEQLNIQQNQKERIHVLREMEQIKQDETLEPSVLQWKGSTQRLQQGGRFPNKEIPQGRD